MASESIYNLLQKESHIEKKSLLYKCTSPMQNVVGSTFGCSGTTRLIGAGKVLRKKFGVFGPSKVPLSDETNVDSILQSIGNGIDKSDRVESRLPKVPSKIDTPVFGLKSNKDFIKLNAVDAMLNVPQKQKIEPDYLRKEDYGKVPAYLKAITAEINREKDLLRQIVDDTKTGGNETMEELSNTERLNLLTLLKSRWEELNCEYQKTAHMVELDTLRKKKRKEELESELDAIEKDILKLETAKKILIKHT